MTVAAYRGNSTALATVGSKGEKVAEKEDVTVERFVPGKHDIFFAIKVPLWVIVVWLAVGISSVCSDVLIFQQRIQSDDAFTRRFKQIRAENEELAELLRQRGVPITLKPLE